MVIFMVRRVKSKYKKYLGSRTFGGGNAKNRRGKGSRGGKGYAGAHKHRWGWILKYEPDHFGKRGKGFINKNASPKLDVINVGDIADLATAGKIEKSGNMFVFSFPGKILGAGSISVPVHVKAVTATESAKKKIESAGGKLELQIQPGNETELAE
jgi:large subunit ribosomal protein L15